MTELKMTILQGDNGWIVEYTGHDGSARKVITTRWERVLEEVIKQFGWYDMQGIQHKKPFFPDKDNK